MRDPSGIAVIRALFPARPLLGAINLMSLDQMCHYFAGEFCLPVIYRAAYGSAHTDETREFYRNRGLLQSANEENSQAVKTAQRSANT